MIAVIPALHKQQVAAIGQVVCIHQRVHVSYSAAKVAAHLHPGTIHRRRVNAIYRPGYRAVIG